MEEKHITLLAKVLVIIFTILLIISLTALIVVYEIGILDIELAVANRLGFNTNRDKMYFGTVPPGNTGLKRVIIENKEYKKSVVRIKIRGELKDWIKVSENNFILQKGESKQVNIELMVPRDAELKDYESKLLIVLTRF